MFFLLRVVICLSVFIGSSEDQTTPMLVTALKGLKVMDVACGSGDAQTLAVTENGKNLFDLSSNIVSINIKAEVF